MRDHADFVKELDFVLIENDQIIGQNSQNIFVKTALKADDGTSRPILTMGPICIAHEKRKASDAVVRIKINLPNPIEL